MKNPTLEVNRNSTKIDTTLSKKAYINFTGIRKRDHRCWYHSSTYSNLSFPGNKTKSSRTSLIHFASSEYFLHQGYHNVLTSFSSSWPPSVFETSSEQLRPDVGCVWQVLPTCTSWELSSVVVSSSAAELSNSNLLCPALAVQEGLKRIFWEEIMF